jgi:HD-like signal output (HDOD) protein
MMEIKTFIRQAGTLPSLPSVYYEMSYAVDNPNSSLGSIGNIIRKDQSLASRLLRMANSALYSFPSKVETIEEALQLIGLREMRDLALATCVIKAFSNLPSHLVDAPSFWRHSIACACASSILAEKRQDPTPERFFVGGLMHDIGHLVIYTKAPLESKEILTRSDKDNVHLLSLERQILGFDHAELGGELMDIWRLPPALSSMIRRHHAPANTSVGCGDDAIIHCADYITTAIALGNSGESTLGNLSHDAVQFCLLEGADLESLVQEIESRCNQLCPIMDTNASQ